METAVSPPISGKNIFLECFRPPPAMGWDYKSRPAGVQEWGRGRAAVGREACWEL